jgi:hypothetical protein
MKVRFKNQTPFKNNEFVDNLFLRLFEDKEFVDYLLSLSTKQAGKGGSNKHDPRKVKLWLDSILYLYLNDKNSSSIREYITYQKVKSYYEDKGTGWKFKYNRRKRGYDAKAEKNVNNRKLTLHIEIKPKNAEKLGFRDLHIGISDYTPERLRKDLKKVNSNSFLTYVTSGFIRGQLMYVIETPFICVMPTLLELLIERYAPNEKKGDLLEKKERIKDEVHKVAEKFANSDIETMIITGIMLFKKIKQTTLEILASLERPKQSYLRQASVPGKEIASCPMTTLLYRDKAIYNSRSISKPLKKFIKRLDEKLRRGKNETRD